MRRVLLRRVYPVRAGDVNGFACILLTARLLSGILVSGHHHRPRLSLSDDLLSTIVPTMQESQCSNPLLSFLQKTSVTILFPTQNKCHNCHKCPNGDIGDKCPNGDKSRMASHVCELRSVPTLDGIASRSCSARATLAGSPWEQLHATL